MMEAVCKNYLIAGLYLFDMIQDSTLSIIYRSRMARSIHCMLSLTSSSMTNLL
jgi:hypothetical protein